VTPRVLIPSDGLRACVLRLGDALSMDYPDGVVMVAILKGGVLFVADLVRVMTVPVEVDFVSISPYSAGHGASPDRQGPGDQHLRARRRGC